MAISAFKTCKVWFSLNPSMCNSGFYRIPGSNVCFSLSIFSSLYILLKVFLKNFFFLVFFSFFAAFSSQPIPSFYNGVFGLPGEPLVPLFCPFANRARPVPIMSVSPVSVFSHSFLLSALILLKVLGWPSSLGCAEVCPSRHPRFWHFFHFSLFFPIWAESCSANLKAACYHSFFCASLFWFPESFSVCTMRGRWVLLALAFFLLLFLVFFFCLFLSSCPSLPLSLCLKGSAPLDGSWGSLLLIPCRGSFFLFGYFLVWALGSSKPFFYSLMGLLYLLLWA